MRFSSESSNPNAPTLRVPTDAQGLEFCEVLFVMMAWGDRWTAGFADQAEHLAQAAGELALNLSAATILRWHGELVAGTWVVQQARNLAMDLGDGIAARGSLLQRVPPRRLTAAQDV